MEVITMSCFSSFIFLSSFFLFASSDSLSNSIKILILCIFRKSFALGAQLTRDLPGEPMSVQEIHKMRFIV